MKPNILYLHSHDTGRYIQPFGHAIDTPNLQKLAEEGVLFRNAFAVAPTCTPSRIGLLTGRSAHSNGLLGLAHRGFGINDYRAHIVRTLRKVGYTSTLIGVQHIAADAAEIGYDTVLLQEAPLKQAVANSKETVQVSPVAADIVETAKTFLGSNPAEPFFLSVGFYETHREFHKPDIDEDPRYCSPPTPLPDIPAIREDMAAYKASARVLDDSMGMVLETLDASGFKENTLVICTTDHGIAFPSMKCNLTDSGIGVFLIMRGPNGFEGGLVVDAMVSHLDLFPTICDLLKVKKPDWLEGDSLLPLINGTKKEIHDAVFAEINVHASPEPQRAVRTKRWKYIVRFDGRRKPVLPNIDDSPSKEALMARGLAEQRIFDEQLYDLIVDPNESCNLADRLDYRDILKEMRNHLELWMEQTKDPLLAGPIQLPKGAVYNDPDGVSPGEPTVSAA